jgi:hypothetical protein
MLKKCYAKSGESYCIEGKPLPMGRELSPIETEPDSTLSDPRLWSFPTWASNTAPTSSPSDRTEIMYTVSDIRSPIQEAEIGASSTSSSRVVSRLSIDDLSKGIPLLLLPTPGIVTPQHIQIRVPFREQHGPVSTQESSVTTLDSQTSGEDRLLLSLVEDVNGYSSKGKSSRRHKAMQILRDCARLLGGCFHCWRVRPVSNL